MKRNHIGIIGLVIGLIAIGIAIFQGDLRPEKGFREIAAESAKKILRENILKEEPENSILPDSKKPHDLIEIIYMGLGFIAMVLGITSWIRKDHIRISGGAVAVGLVAVSWEFVLIGVIIAVVILLVANLS